MLPLKPAVEMQKLSVPQQDVSFKRLLASQSMNLKRSPSCVSRSSLGFRIAEGWGNTKGFEKKEGNFCFLFKKKRILSQLK